MANELLVWKKSPCSTWTCWAGLCISCINGQFLGSSWAHVQVLEELGWISAFSGHRRWISEGRKGGWLLARSSAAPLIHSWLTAGQGDAFWVTTLKSWALQNNVLSYSSISKCTPLVYWKTACLRHVWDFLIIFFPKNTENKASRWKVTVSLYRHKLPSDYN